STLVAGGAKLLNDAQGTVPEVRAKLGTTLDTITSTVSNANDLVAGLKEGRGTAGMLLRDEALAGHIREAVTNTQQATADLGHASSEAAALMTDLRSRGIPQRADEIMDHLTDSARQVHQVVSDIAKPDQEGMSAAANIRESLMNASTATANLADASEALKHNFFTRGFFKDRGYYTLADLSPEKYRRDRTFTSRTHNRVWLSGSDLFQHGSDGE